MNMSDFNGKIPAHLITESMRTDGINEDTVFATREEMVARFGEEMVAEIEASAVPAEEVESGTNAAADAQEVAADAPVADAPVAEDAAPEATGDAPAVE